MDREDTLETATPESATAQPVAVTDPVTAPAAAPEAPAANGSAEPASLLDAALKALAPEKGDGAAAAAQSAGDAGDSSPAQTPEPQADDQGESLADVPMLPDAVFKALPKEARTAIVDLRKRVKTLQPDADRGAALSRYIAESGVTPDEYVQLQDVGALLKRDPAAARKIIVDKLAEIDRALGNTLPDDLREEVDGGFISEERARELSQARARADRAESTAAATSAEVQQGAMLADVTAWEAEVRRADPDFARKLPDIQARTKLAAMEAAAAGKPVRTGAEAVAMAAAAYKAVNDMLSSFRPAPAATPRVPSSAASAPATAPTPKTLLEAAMAGLRGKR